MPAPPHTVHAMTHTAVDAIGGEPCRRDSACSLGERSGLPMTISRPDEKTLIEAFSIIEDTPNIDGVVSKLRDLVHVDHVVYHSSKLGASPSDPQRGPYIRLTYPASWIMRYLQMGYADVDPVLREAFRRTIPFEWSELSLEREAEASFLADAASHGVGPHGFSVPVLSKRGHRGHFAVSSSRSAQEWSTFLRTTRSTLIEIANRLHRRVIAEVFGEDGPHLTARELECLRWVALGKSTGEIAAILKISPHTTREYLKSVHHKLDCVTSAQAVSKAIQLGLLTL
jgi:LuxR family transcriptional regulator, quorum-sensing system regulator CinR